MKCFMTLVLATFTFSNFAMADLVVYSDRPAARFSNSIQQFKQATGENVIFVEGSYSDLIKRLEIEGDDSKADLIITKDLVYLSDLTKKGMLKSFTESNAVKRVADFMRGTRNEWVTITFRARTAIYNPTLVSKSELSTYQDLADSKWEQGLCLRTGKAAYNQALVAGLISKHGAAKAKQTVQGWVNNLKIAPLGDDTAVINEVARGNNCQVGIVNHYYFAMAKDKDPNLGVEIAFLDQNSSGVFTNGTAAGLLQTSKNSQNAQTFLELMLNDDNQLAISSAHFDYPAVQGLTPNTLIKEWGSFKMNPASWDSLGELIPQSRAIISEVGYE